MSTTDTEKVQPRFKLKYKNEVVPALVKEFNYKNEMQVPKLEKICVNIGIGEYVQTPKILDIVIRDIMTITGQKQVVVKYKKRYAKWS